MDNGVKRFVYTRMGKRAKVSRKLSEPVAKNFKMTEEEAHNLAFAAESMKTSEIAIVRDALALYYGSLNPGRLRRQVFVSGAIKEAGLPTDPSDSLETKELRQKGQPMDNRPKKTT